MNKFKTVGHDEIRVDGKAKITGAAQYVDDMDFGPSLLYAEIVESPHAHALIKEIDTTEAMKLPGVRAVVTGKDFPYTFGLYLKDRFIFAMDRVRFVGEQVAAVVADNPETARKAASLVRVTYEKLPSNLTIEESLKKGSFLIHPDLHNYHVVPWLFPQKGRNISHLRTIRKGDVEKGFKEADFVLEDTYRVPRYSHCAIETHIAVAKLDYSGRLTLWSASQSPYTQRNLIADALKELGFSHKDVRVITPFVGGGFGGKAGVTMEILAAVLAVKVKGRPVKMRFNRAQEFYNTYQRQGTTATLKVGVKKDGSITGFKHVVYWDAGAYTEYGANVTNSAGLSATGPYRIPNVYIDSVCVYTNLPPGGPYRGFGYSELLFGIESHFDRIAQEIGMDPVEFRRKNAIRGGDTLCYGAHMNPNGLLECIDKVSKEIEWDKKDKTSQPHKAVGKGFACFWKAPAMPPNAGSSAFLKFNEDASMNILISGMEIGQGLLTVMAQVASEVLTVPVEKIRVETPDTDYSPYEWQTVASHVTWGCGNAVRMAAEDAREQIFEMVNKALHYNISDLYLENQKVKCKTDSDFSLNLEDIVINGIQLKDGTFRGRPVLGRGSFMPQYASAISDPKTSQGGHPNVHYTVGAAAVKLEIDRQTGKLRILKAVEALDCGKALNPLLVKQQIIGGLLQGLATALYEDMRFDVNGKLLNPNFTDYKIPTAMDIPDEVVPIIVEVPQFDGPFGARGAGEHPMIPAAPMIANAIYDGVKIRLKSMPLTAEKVALKLHSETT
ncbi:MAG: xanthine dehydrogenase family protein molybdopterin-binding subunit [Vulcanimicrobiota bacterium]